MQIFKLAYSEFVTDIAAGISFLEQVFENLISTIFDNRNWLVSGFVCVCIVFGIVCIVIEFFEDFAELTGDHVLYKERKQSIEVEREMKHKQRLTEAEEIYKKRRDEQRRYYEQLYRERSGNNKPLVDYNNVYSKSSFDNGVLTIRYYDRKTNELVDKKQI